MTGSFNIPNDSAEKAKVEPSMKVRVFVIDSKTEYRRLTLAQLAENLNQKQPFSYPSFSAELANLAGDSNSAL